MNGESRRWPPFRPEAPEQSVLASRTTIRGFLDRDDVEDRRVRAMEQAVMPLPTRTMSVSVGSVFDRISESR